MMKNVGYPFRIWMTGTLVGPLIFILLTTTFHSEQYSGLGGLFPLAYIYFFIFGTALSVPAFLLFWLAHELMTRFAVNTKKIKIILSSLCLILSAVTFMAVPLPEKNSVLDAEFGFLMIGYCVPLVLGVLLYKKTLPPNF